MAKNDILNETKKIKTKSTASLKGEYILRMARNGRIIQEVKLTNLLMEDYRTAISDALIDGTSTINDFEIKFVGLGDDDTAPTRFDTQLGNELFRKSFQQKQEVNKDVVTIWNIVPAEAIFEIKEIGVFCGSSATATPNSGTLLSRVVLPSPFDKTANDTLNIVRRDVIKIG